MQDMAKTSRTNMTLNYERNSAVLQTRKFLMRLMNPQETPRVPRAIRAEARQLLKHYPEPHHMEVAAKQLPTIFGIDWRDEYK